MPAPYITPAMLQAAPTGISWTTIPSNGATGVEQLAAMMGICRRATSMVDARCNQVLGATMDTEEIIGPDYRLTVQGPIARAMLSRFPVLSIVSAAATPTAQFPPQWNDIPVTSMGLDGGGLDLLPGGAFAGSVAGPAAILISSAYVGWRLGRNGYRVRVTYTNGWPNTLLTAAASAGDATLEVDEVTGWIGMPGTIEDGGNSEAVIPASASVAMGPGILTLASPLRFKHNIGVLYTALPPVVQQAAILYATAQSLLRGSTAVSVQSLPGVRTGGGGPGRQELIDEANDYLESFRRVI